MRFAARLGILAVFILVVSAVAHAQPRYAFNTTYFDDNGNEVGYHWNNCVSQSWGGTSSSNATVQYGEECFVEPTPFSCSDEGMTTIGSCEVSQWCVTQGYYMSYMSHNATDCEGNCYQGWCFTKSRVRRSKPTLTAVLNAKFWELLAVMRR